MLCPDRNAPRLEDDLRAGFFGTRFLIVRLVGVRLLRDARDLSAMIPPTWPTPPCHGPAGGVTPKSFWFTASPWQGKY
jgi:hypothetical protein